MTNTDLNNDTDVNKGCKCAYDSVVNKNLTVKDSTVVVKDKMKDLIFKVKVNSKSSVLKDKH